MKNLSLYQADALNEGWGGDFDVVVLAGNLLVNIETGGGLSTGTAALYPESCGLPYNRRHDVSGL